MTDEYHALKDTPEKKLLETIRGYMKNTKKYPLRFSRTEACKDATVSEKEFNVLIWKMEHQLTTEKTKVAIVTSVERRGVDVFQWETFYTVHTHDVVEGAWGCSVQ